MSAVQVNSEKQNIVERKPSTSDSSSVLERADPAEAEKGADREYIEDTKEHPWTSYARLRPFILGGIALVILGWWISSIALPATRHRWSVSQFKPKATFFVPISNVSYARHLLSPTGSYRRSGHGPSSCECGQKLLASFSCERTLGCSIDCHICIFPGSLPSDSSPTRS